MDQKPGIEIPSYLAPLEYELLLASSAFALYNFLDVAPYIKNASERVHVAQPNTAGLSERAHYHDSYQLAQRQLVEQAKEYRSDQDDAGLTNLQSILDGYAGFRLLDMANAPSIGQLSRSFVGTRRFFDGFFSAIGRLDQPTLNRLDWFAANMGKLYLNVHQNIKKRQVPRNDQRMREFSKNAYYDWKDYFATLKSSSSVMMPHVDRVVAQRDDEVKDLRPSGKSRLYFTPENTQLYLEELQARYIWKARALTIPSDDIRVVDMVMDTLTMLELDGNEMAGKFNQILHKSRLGSERGFKGFQATAQLIDLANIILAQKGKNEDPKPKLANMVQVLPLAVQEILEWCIPSGDAIMEWDADPTHRIDLMHLATVEETVTTYSFYKQMTTGRRVGKAMLAGADPNQTLQRMYERLGAPAQMKQKIAPFQPGFGALS